MPARKNPRRPTAGTRARKTRRVLDRHGHPAPMVTMKDMSQRTGTFLRTVDRLGAVAVSQRGKPVVVALSADHFVALCVSYAMRTIGASAPK